MHIIFFLLLLFGALCFALSAFQSSRRDTPASPINLVALGLFFWILVPLLQSLLHLAD